MKQKKILSIGITAYNEEANIDYLLHSILSQKTDNFILKEIIVISDGGNDRTVKIIKKIEDKKIKLIVGKTRVGQNKRLNEIVKYMSKNSTCLLILEADTLPANNVYVKNLISSIPSNGKFSMIVGNSIPVESQTLFERVINFGNELKMEIFETSDGINLYLCGGQEGRLFSRSFLKNFRWVDGLHDDSYSFRKAQESGMPILKNKSSKIYFKSVESVKDYLLQSGKFQKAKNKEDNLSDIYTLKLNFIKAFIKTSKFFFKNPILLCLYFAVVLYSRIRGRFFNQYTVFWDIYKSSKNLNNRVE